MGESDALPAMLGHLAVVGAFVALMAAAAVEDLRGFRISNRLVVAVLALYPLHLWLAPWAVNGLGGVITALILFALGAGLFALGGMGGGDVKLLAALGLWAGPVEIWTVLAVVALAGGLLALAILAGRRWHRAKGGDGDSVHPGPAPQGWRARVDTLIHAPVVPYGVPIGLGGGVLGFGLFLATLGQGSPP